MNVTIVFFSSNRLEYLIPTLKSFFQQLNFSDLNLTKILIDDYPKNRDDNTFFELKEYYGIDHLILHEENKGQSETWKEAWSMISNDTDFIWHQEDDFTFNKPISIKRLIKIFNYSSIPLTQICLKRQPWYSDSHDFIKKIEQGELGKEIEVKVGKEKESLIIHQYYFNANPCIYPYWVTQEKFKHNPQESVIAEELRERYPKAYSSILGKRNDPSLSHHIGIYTQGKKINPGEPGWDWMKDFNPDKKYYSDRFLTEYNLNS